MRADTHDGREQMFPSKGRIQMSKTNHLQIVTSSLHRTAGPYRWVIFGHFGPSARRPLSAISDRSVVRQVAAVRLVSAREGCRRTVNAESLGSWQIVLVTTFKSLTPLRKCRCRAETSRSVPTLAANLQSCLGSYALRIDK